MSKLGKRSNSTKSDKSMEDDGIFNFFRKKDTEQIKENKKEDVFMYDPNDFNYKMNHKKRGKAIIFNNYSCDSNVSITKKIKQDVRKLETTLTQQLKFEVLLYNNLELVKIFETLKILSCENDFTNDDCLAVFIIIRGTVEHLISENMQYSAEKLWEIFTPDKCSSLAAKPKLFFINACFEDTSSNSTIFKDIESTSEVPTKEPEKIYVLPMYSDFLAYYSTVQESMKIDKPVYGLWFIKFLCDALNNEKVRKLELKKILTIVTKKTILKYCQNGINYNIPTVMSTLIRNLRFAK